MGCPSLYILRRILVHSASFVGAVPEVFDGINSFAAKPLEFASPYFHVLWKLYSLVFVRRPIQRLFPHKLRLLTFAIFLPLSLTASYPMEYCLEAARVFRSLAISRAAFSSHISSAFVLWSFEAIPQSSNGNHVPNVS